MPQQPDEVAYDAYLDQERQRCIRFALDVAAKADAAILAIRAERGSSLDRLRLFVAHWQWSRSRFAAPPDSEWVPGQVHRWNG